MSSPVRSSRRFEEVEPPASDWLDRLAQFYQRYGHYIRDFAGLALIVLALTSVIALLGGSGIIPTGGIALLE